MVTKPTEGSFVAIMRQGKEGSEILLSVRVDGKGWNLIGGRVEEGETPELCAIRETLEETGLEVEVLGRINGPFPMINDRMETIDIARVYSAQVYGGTLRDSDESNGFHWVGIDGLCPGLPVVRNSCPGYSEGRTYAMVEFALKNPDQIFSEISDPDGIAVGARFDADVSGGEW